MFDILSFAALQAAGEPAAAEAGQPPRLIHPPAITAEDYPTEAFRRDEYGIVSVLLRVSNVGEVTSCKVTESSGFYALDAGTCSLLKVMARFDPAKDAGGNAVPGEYRMPVGWGMEQHSAKTSFDFSLQVNAIPPDYRVPLKAKAIFDPLGRMTACEVSKSSGSVAGDRAACAYVKQKFTIAAPKSASIDVPAAAVRYLSISLSTQPLEKP